MRTFGVGLNPIDFQSGTLQKSAVSQNNRRQSWAEHSYNMAQSTGQGLVLRAELRWGPGPRSGETGRGELGKVRKGCSQGPDTLTSIFTVIIPLKVCEWYWQWRKVSRSVREQQGFQKTWKPVRCSFWKRDCLFIGFFILVKSTSCQR